jgi:cytochrome P450
VNVEAEEGGLTEDKIVANAMLLLLAGHVAVRNLIGNFVYLLLTHPDQWSRVQANPELLHNAIEETLRYETPVSLIPRIASKTSICSGRPSARGR